MNFGNFPHVFPMFSPCFPQQNPNFHRQNSPGPRHPTFDDQIFLEGSVTEGGSSGRGGRLRVEGGELGASAAGVGINGYPPVN